jgi:hypothetical protein
MAGAERYSIYPGIINNGGLTLRQIGGVDLSPNTQKADIVLGGAVDRVSVPTVSADPTASISTDDLYNVLGGVSLTTGLAISSVSTFQYQQREDTGVFAAGSTHDIVTVQKGFLTVSSITSSQDDEEGAQCQLALAALYNGSVEPLVHATTQALTSTPSFTARYFHGPVYHNSSQVDGIISTTVNPGLAFAAKRADGSVFPTVGSIVARLPTITFTTLKINAAGVANMFHGALAGTLACYYPLGVTSGTRSASSDNIKISAATGDWAKDGISVSANDDGTASVTVRPTTTLAVSTASSIP